MCSQWETKLPLPRFWDCSSVEISECSARMETPLLLFKFNLFFLIAGARREEQWETRWRVWRQQGRLLSADLNAPSYVGVAGAGPVTICDNCDDNDILVCNVCVHTTHAPQSQDTEAGVVSWWLKTLRSHHQIHCHSSPSFDNLQLN